MAESVTIRAEHTGTPFQARQASKKHFLAQITGRDAKMTFARSFLSHETTFFGSDCAALIERRNVDKKDRTDDEYYLLLETSDGGVSKFDIDRSDAIKIAKLLDDGRRLDTVVALVPAVVASPLGALVKERSEHVRILVESVHLADDGIVNLGPVTAARLGVTVTTIVRSELRTWRNSEIARLDAEIATRRAAGEDEIMPEDEMWEFTTPKKAEAAVVAAAIDSTTEACWALIQSLPEASAKKVLAALKLRVSPPKPAKEVGLTPDAPVGVVSDANQDAGVSEAALGLAPTATN